MNFDKIEKFSVKMEKWHNRLYKFFIIGVFLFISDIIGLGIIGWGNYRALMINSPDTDFILFMYDIIIYLGSPLIYAFLIYTMIFTKFNFPIQFKGGGKGRKIDPPYTIR